MTTIETQDLDRQLKQLVGTEQNRPALEIMDCGYVVGRTPAVLSSSDVAVTPEEEEAWTRLAGSLA